MSNDFTIKDTGERRTFDSGAQRDRGTEKSRPDLISPFLLDRLGWHLAKGAKKYSAWNWAKGMPSSEYWASLNRHVMEAAKGDTTEDHLSAIVFNAMGIIQNQEMKKLGLLKPEFDDWPVDWKALTQPQRFDGMVGMTGVQGITGVGITGIPIPTDAQTAHEFGKAIRDRLETQRVVSDAEVAAFGKGSPLHEFRRST